MNPRLFNEAEIELIEAAQTILRDGLQRLKARPALFPTDGKRQTANDCKEAREAVAASLVTQYGAHSHETAIVVLIDAQGRYIATEEFPRGKATHCELSPRLLAGFVLKHEASCVLLAHNHPSGVCSPSGANVALTKSLHAWLKSMDCDLIDHLVLTAGDWCAIRGNW